MYLIGLVSFLQILQFLLKLPTQGPVPMKDPPCKFCHGPCLAELTQHRPFVDTGRLVIIRKKLPGNRVTVHSGEVFILF